MSLHRVKFDRSQVGDMSGEYVQAADAMDVIETLVEALASIENDDGSIPARIWDMRNAALAKARGES